MFSIISTYSKIESKGINTIKKAEIIFNDFAWLLTYLLFFSHFSNTLDWCAPDDAIEESKIISRFVNLDNEKILNPFFSFSLSHLLDFLFIRFS